MFSNADQGEAVVQSVKRSVCILQELTGAAPRLGLTELAERIGISKSAVHGLLRTLQSDGLVTQDPESGKYRLGPALVTFGNAYLDTHELRTRAVTCSNLLGSRTGEAVWVGVLASPFRLRRGQLVVWNAKVPSELGR
ncbi:IclR family transcriptional regulator [Streptomyces sp. NPDC005811]|uniref:IclR family transcriptional regulator n=1 Tax=Streptomyces sp. NPDC005811 TaxID=3154565 RepID=UPI0033E150A3